MKTKVKILILALSFGTLTTIISCNNGDDDCPSQSFNSLQECEDATDGKKCVCVKEGSVWKAILNP